MSFIKTKKINLFIITMLILFSHSAIASSEAADHPAIINSDNCLSGPYETRDNFVQVITDFMPFDPSIIKRVVSEEWFEHFQSHYECRRFTYSVDNHNVIGYMIRKSERGDQQPALVYHRGGNANFGSLNPWIVLNKLRDFADEGYSVFASNLRTRDEFGGSDVHDSRVMIDIALQTEGVNTQQIALWGESRGATQMMQAARGREDVHALVFSMGVADAEKSLEQRAELEQVYVARVPNFTAHREDALRERSVIHWSDELPPVPVLIIHGEQDRKVSVKQAHALATQLKRLNHPHTLMVYPSMGHNMSKEAKLDMLEWLKETLTVQN